MCTRSASNLIMWLTCISLHSVPVNQIICESESSDVLVLWDGSELSHHIHMFMMKTSPTFKIHNNNLLFILSTQQNDDADLVRYIKKNYGSYFCTSVAGYPEGMYGYFLSHFVKALWSRHYILKLNSRTLRLVEDSECMALVENKNKSSSLFTPNSAPHVLFFLRYTNPETHLI